MGFLLFVAVVAGVIGFVTLLNRMNRTQWQIERLLARIERLEQGGVSSPPLAKTPARGAALAARPPVATSAPVAEPPPTVAAQTAKGPARVGEPDLPRTPTPPREVPSPRVRLPRISVSFETLIGAKLPIWIGGIALILAGFFLVRYSVEQGLLGPAVRSVMAALLGLILLGGSEAARRIPRFAADPRVGQALAGAGIASLYGTLYMAGQLFGLISPTTAFLLMAGVTAVALFLSLRHGPPTAIMGLIGGFTAPFMAAPSGNLMPLLVYLGLLIAGLFAVSIHRGWRWLALAATGGGTLWTLGIMAAGLTGIGASLGVFVIVLALAATLLFPRSGIADARLRLLPMVLGFVQLALFAPIIEFDATGWALYGLLSAAGLYLGWRDEKLMPASLAALGLVLILLIGAFDQVRPLAPWAALGATALFAIPGHALARRGGTTQFHWTMLALAGGAGPLLVAWGSAPGLLPDSGWSALFAMAAVPAALLSWRARGEGRQTSRADWALFGGGVLAALLACIVAGLLVKELWSPVAGLAVALAVAAWARQVKDQSLSVASLVFAAGAGIIWLAGLATHEAMIPAILLDGPIPAPEPLGALLGVPALLFAALAWCHSGRRSDPPLRWIVMGCGLALLTALVPQGWHPLILAIAAAAATVAGARLPLPRFGLEGILAVAGLAILFRLLPFGGILGSSLAGLRVHYGQLPGLWDALRGVGLPSLILGGVTFWRADRFAGPFGIVVRSGAGTGVGAMLYDVAKQPFAIATEAQFVVMGFVERAAITQLLAVLGVALLWRGGGRVHRAALAVLAIAAARFVWFDLLVLNPIAVEQNVGGITVLNGATVHFGLAALWCWLAGRKLGEGKLGSLLSLAALPLSVVAAAITVRQAFQGATLNGPGPGNGENYTYSAVLLLLAILWLWRGISGGARGLRMAGLLAMTLVTFKVFLIDAAALEGLLRVLSFLGLGGALIGIGWVYTRVLSREAVPEAKDGG